MPSTKPYVAIRKFCLECMGGSSGDVNRCTVIDCPVYELRLGRPVKQKTLTKEQYARRIELGHELAEYNKRQREKNNEK